MDLPGERNGKVVSAYVLRSPYSGTIEPSGASKHPNQRHTENTDVLWTPVTCDILNEAIVFPEDCTPFVGCAPPRNTNILTMGLLSCKPCCC